MKYGRFRGKNPSNQPIFERGQCKLKLVNRIHALEIPSTYIRVVHLFKLKNFKLQSILDIRRRIPFSEIQIGYRLNNVLRIRLFQQLFNDCVNRYLGIRCKFFFSFLLTRQRDLCGTKDQLTETQSLWVWFLLRRWDKYSLDLQMLFLRLGVPGTRSLWYLWHREKRERVLNRGSGLWKWSLCPALKQLRLAKKIGFRYNITPKYL